jgi:hypothetical protein
MPLLDYVTASYLRAVAKRKTAWAPRLLLAEAELAIEKAMNTY